MRLGESRLGDAKLVWAAQQLVRGWVWLYTLGLPLETRNTRRIEIDSDLWEQTHAWGVHSPTTSGIASSVFLRCLRGVPADLLWRFSKARTHRSSTEGTRALQKLTLGSSFGLATIIIMAILVVASIALIAVHTIEYNDPSTRLMVPWLKYALGFLLLALGLVSTGGGFGLIRRAPWLGAVLTASGIWMVAVLFYWMWFPVPLFIAAGVSVFAIRWAKMNAEVDDREKAKNE